MNIYLWHHVIIGSIGLFLHILMIGWACSEGEVTVKRGPISYAFGALWVGAVLAWSIYLLVAQ